MSAISHLTLTIITITLPGIKESITLKVMEYAGKPKSQQKIIFYRKLSTGKTISEKKTKSTLMLRHLKNVRSLIFVLMNFNMANRNFDSKIPRK